MPFRVPQLNAAGASYAITDIDIRWEYYAEARYEYKIETSLNNTNWSSLIEVTTTSERKKTHELEFDGSTQARYVRITITAVDNGWACFEEFKVFGY